MMFGKTMSIPDDMILPYFRLATDRSAAAVGEIENRLKQGENPRDLKLDLATDIVGLYHGAPAALRARAEFIKVFSKKELPTVMEGAELHEGSYEAAALILALQLALSVAGILFQSTKKEPGSPSTFLKASKPETGLKIP